MTLPYATEIKQNIEYIQQFTGYNHNLRIEQSDFYDMKNMSLDHYPIISTRQGEDDKFVMDGTPNGLWEYAPDTLMAVSGNQLRVGITTTSEGEIVPNSSILLSDSEKSFATIDAFTVIMPDKVVYDAYNKTLSPIVRNYSSNSYDGQYLIMQIVPCDGDGEPLDPVISDIEPSDTDKLWYDTGNKVYKVYNTSTNTWVQTDTSFMKMIPRISASQTVYTKPEELNPTAVEDRKELSDFFKGLTDYDSVTYAGGVGSDAEFQDYVVYKVGEEDGVNFLVLAAILEPTVTQFTVRTKCPDLDHLVALNNRVWGVSNSTHEVFACKLGDPFQWFNYAGIASDSYAVTLGFTDEVTAGVAFNNNVIFFTEDKLLKFYGDYPSNFRLHTTIADGVVKGGHDTVVQVEGVLFYVSPIGVMAYDGSLPRFYGERFAPDFLNGKTVVAGKDGTKYCLSVSKNGVSEGVFVLDTKHRLWTIGGDQIFLKTADLGNALCFINDSGHLVTLFDRLRTSDRVMTVYDNIFEIDDREQTGFIGDN